MFASLSKKRSKSNLLTIHMKFLLILIIGILFYNSQDARYFTADQLNNLSELIRPDHNQIKINF